MRFRRPLLVLGMIAGNALSMMAGASALLPACDPSSASPGSEGEAGDASMSDSTAPVGDATDANVDPDARPCADCEYFPEGCSADALCPNGPFGASGLDPRTEILVIRGRAADDVWVAGGAGGAAHFDGTSWTRSDTGTQEALRAFWLRESQEVALGSFTKVHVRDRDFDAGPDASMSAGGWWRQPIPPFAFDIGMLNFKAGWSPPGTDILWIASATVPEGSGLWRLHASAPSSFEIVEGVSMQRCFDIPCQRMLALHGASAETFWSVGETGAAIRVTGANTDTPVAKPFNSLTTIALRAVWSASDSEAWAVGANGTIRRYRGDPLLWEVVEDVPTKETLNAVWGTSTSDVWAVGNAGVVLHYDGQKWSRVKVAGLGVLRPDFNAVWSPAPGHVWAGGQGTVVSVGGKP